MSHQQIQHILNVGRQIQDGMLVAAVFAECKSQKKPAKLQAGSTGEALEEASPAPGDKTRKPADSVFLPWQVHPSRRDPSAVSPRLWSRRWPHGILFFSFTGLPLEKPGSAEKASRSGLGWGRRGQGGQSLPRLRTHFPPRCILLVPWQAQSTGFLSLRVVGFSPSGSEPAPEPGPAGTVAQVGLAPSAWLARRRPWRGEEVDAEARRSLASLANCTHL